MRWYSKSSSWLIPSGIFIFSAILRFFALNQSPHPNGWDGYYYVMQAHSFVNYGHLQSLDYSLVYPYFIVITYLFGDYILSFKVGTAILSGVLVLAAYQLVTAKTKQIWTGLFVAAFLIFSPTTTYFISQFPKNVLGVIFFLYFLKALETKHWKSALLFGLLSFFTHRMPGGLVLLVMMLGVLKALNWKWISAAFVTLVGLSFLPGLLHFSDLARFNNQLNLIPQFATYSFYKLFASGMSEFWIIELVILTIGLILMVVDYLGKRHFRSESLYIKLISPCLIIVSIFPFLQVSEGSMGYRFFLLFPIFVIIHLSITSNMRSKWVKGFAVLLLICAIFSQTSYKPELHDPPNGLYEIMISRLEEKYNAGEFPLVISHKSLAEMIIYKTEFDALNWKPSASIEKSKTLRITHQLKRYHFSKYLSEEELKDLQKIGLQYYITTEHTWHQFLNRITAAGDEELMAYIKQHKNPMIERPAYLKKGKQL